MANNLLEYDESKFYQQLFKDFNKTKEDLNSFINMMKKWAETQKHFPEKPNVNLLRFVILYNKFSIEAAKQKLDMFYTARSLVPEFFRNNPLTKDMIFQRNIWYIVPLPKLADDHVRIIYQKLNPEYADPKYFVHEHLQVQFLHLLTLIAENDLSYRIHYICDCDCTKLGHAVKTNLMILKKSQIVLEKVFSNRIVSLYMVNFPAFLENFVNTVAKPILNKKLRERLQIHSGTEILFKLFGKERMPRDIGGEEKSLEELNDMLHQQYELHKDRFLELEKLTVDESLRPAKLKNDEILGYYGNFRKINVD
ncbi:unnamed protein product [Ceutorhynchus assimilis]|uniref:CRAL-TRIO domain-containing protein n=1 Tax=Ceutorhynchus assimilis TaxID=467358 RepID=A0A9N9MYT5_9CUCU|nr:unnamed protein product [Ceutorhynchus assimilis]